jgi:hypothetical protein
MYISYTVTFMCIMVLFVLLQVWAATESGNLEVTYTHTEEQVGEPRLLVLHSLCFTDTSTICIWRDYLFFQLTSSLSLPGKKLLFWFSGLVGNRFQC